MRVKITHPILDEENGRATMIPAGLVFDFPAEKATPWIENGWAFEIPAENPAVESAPSEATKQPEVKRGKRGKHK